MSVRGSFVEQFGEEQAAAIEAAAQGHENGVHDERGSDPFKWAIAIAIGYECVTQYREYHDITVDEDALKAWIVEHGDLASHDGDVDFLAMVVGAYDEYMPKADA